jgi:hypothetical protein
LTPAPFPLRRPPRLGHRWRLPGNRNCRLRSLRRTPVTCPPARNLSGWLEPREKPPAARILRHFFSPRQTPPGPGWGGVRGQPKAARRGSPGGACRGPRAHAGQQVPNIVAMSMTNPQPMNDHAPGQRVVVTCHEAAQLVQVCWPPMMTSSESGFLAARHHHQRRSRAWSVPSVSSSASSAAMSASERMKSKIRAFSSIRSRWVDFGRTTRSRCTHQRRST